ESLAPLSSRWAHDDGRPSAAEGLSNRVRKALRCPCACDGRGHQSGGHNALSAVLRASANEFSKHPYRFRRMPRRTDPATVNLAGGTDGYIAAFSPLTR